MVRASPASILDQHHCGGMIQQTIVKDLLPAWNWDKDNTNMFNVQLLNASSFEQLLGFKPPRTPVTSAVYKRFGYPFFKLYEEPSGIKGKFKAIKSVGEIERGRGCKRARDEVDDLQFRVVKLNKVDRKFPFLPVREMEESLMMVKVNEVIELE
ncbi:hypothetical protein LSUE1_G002974 [Lachnellula suecica]|uniref:Uncharacterized protein n=1 Tax=Lachnellula suecica TaxID=602035 RepID=A0A8T9CIC6_9HELO|nr:hypothetical protein LSUE1_G002974 [Lachnellula suecica]